MAPPACRSHAPRSASDSGRWAHRHPTEWSSATTSSSPSVDLAVTEGVYVGSVENGGPPVPVRRPSPCVHDPALFHPHLGTTLWMDRAGPVDGWAGIGGQPCGEPGMNRGRMADDAARPPSSRPVNRCPHRHIPSQRGLLTSEDALHPHCAQHLRLLLFFSLCLYFPKTSVWKGHGRGARSGHPASPGGTGDRPGWAWKLSGRGSTVSLPANPGSDPASAAPPPPAPGGTARSPPGEEIGPPQQHRRPVTTRPSGRGRGATGEGS